MSRRTARRAAWTLFAAAFALWLAAGVFGWLTRDLEAQTDWGNGGFAVVAMFGIVVLTFPIAGLLIATRRPETPIGWILLAIGLAWGLASTTTYADYGI